MPESQSVAERRTSIGLLVLGVDTCGPTGSVALAQIEGGKATILGQKELAGRTYSAVLVTRIREILEERGLKLPDIGAVVVVSGPGSFTGVRVGLSAVKGLAEPGQISVASASRLEVMAAKAGVGAAALDAHRREVFLRIADPDGSARELLAGAEELGSIPAPFGPIAVCEEEAGSLLRQAWPVARLVQTVAPTAADAIELCVPRVLAGDFADLALLDGHYLRRSDAEIFGGSTQKTPGQAGQHQVRPMKRSDLERVLSIASDTQQAPGWTWQAYEKAIDSEAKPRRIALVAEEAQSGKLVGFAVAVLVPAAGVPPEAELETIVTSLAHQRRGVARELFSSLKHDLRRSGVQELILEVREGNQGARGFYRFLGFAEEGRRRGYYADPVEDAILMRLRIT
jgi:tRNA threonylcarbamoyladenosine biosynthesis protein TsaB